MDRTADGADSAEDSGSSQPYPSTLPGIPKAILYIYYFFLNIKFLLFTSVNENLTLVSYLCLFPAAVEFIFNYFVGAAYHTGQCQTVV